MLPTLAILAVVASFSHNDEYLGGIMLAIAAANVAQGRWFAGWEHDHGRRLLHGTARSLRRYQRDTSPGESRNDQRDFYIAPPLPTP